MYLNIHCHSEYSSQDAISRVSDIAAKNKEDGNDAFVITDHGYLTSWINGYKEADKQEIQFIPGCEFYVLPDKPEFWVKNKKEVELVEDAKRYYHLIAIAKNQTGVQSLISLFNTNELHWGKPCITKENLFKHKDGLIVTNACVSGEILCYLRHGRDDYAEQALLEYVENFGDDFYVEIQHHGLTFMDEIGTYKKLIDLARKHGIKMVPTTDSHFTDKKDKRDHDIYKNIFRSNVTGSLEIPNGFDGEGYYIKNEEEIKETMRRLGSLTEDEIDQMVKNTEEIRNKCEKTEFPRGKGLSDQSERLEALVDEGFKAKRVGTELEKESEERIKFELDTIKNMGFTEYFVNVYDIVNRARDLDIMVGCGRGSAAGSEICYLLGITSIDPIKNGLMFERFLNPYRFNYPDIDIDFQSRYKDGESGKTALIRSLEDIFPFSGQIMNEARATPLTLFKRLGSYLGIPYKDLNRVTGDGVVSDELTKPSYTGWIQEALERLGIPYSDKWQALEKDIDFCYTYGSHQRGDKADGLLSGTSTHASGVILYPTKNLDVLPKADGCVTYRGHALEEMGYIKYDLLGLASLDPIAYFIPRIEADTGKKFDWEDTYDEETWETFKRADTDFVFQFSSNGMKHGLAKVRPDNISTLAELNALYRPGCIKAGIFNSYINDSFTDDQKIVGSFLKGEFGEDHSDAMIYQEDIMKIVEKMAGFTLGDADLVRRAVARKEEDLMASYEKEFIDGFTYGDEELARSIWSAINGCASYVFNKSHAVGYACIAYWTAYIFTHYQNDFFKWMLDNDQDKAEAIQYLASHGREIVLPTLKTKNTEWLVTDTKVYVPTTEVFGQTVSEFLFSLDTDKRKAIVKYGVLDDFCMDRKGIRDLMNMVQVKKYEKLSDAQKKMLDVKTFREFIDALAALDFIDYEKNSNVYDITVYKARSEKKTKIDLTPGANDDFNCQEDIRAFGIVRSSYADYYPFKDYTDLYRTAVENGQPPIKALQEVYGKYKLLLSQECKCVIHKYDTKNNEANVVFADTALTAKMSKEASEQITKFGDNSVFYCKFSFSLTRSNDLQLTINTAER